MLSRAVDLWKQYLNSGSRHFTTPSDLKQNRVLNLLFSLNYIANLYLSTTALTIYVILLQRDAARYKHYFLPFAIINTSYLILITGVILLKNRWGTFQVTYLSNLIYTSFCVLLSFFLGEKVGIQLILLSLIPIIFTIYEYGRWLDMILQTGIMSIGIVVALFSYKVMPPLYPIPQDIAEVAGYLTWFMALVLIFIYSIYNWKQVYETEHKLYDEKNQTSNLLNDVIPQLEYAEAKYRHLVDESSDMIFQMGDTSEILSMNKTARTMLGYAPDEMIGLSLYQFIPDGHEGDVEINRNIVRERMKDFFQGADYITFKTTLRKKHMYEPLDVQISLQKTQRHGKLDILGKISRIEEDVSQKFLQKEKGRYVIGNSVTHAEILSQKLTERLSRHFSPNVVATLRICFREILVNAIEHGNLGISFDEKTRAIEAGDYMQFLLKRQQEAEYRDKKIYVDYLINENILMFRISDEGTGFDHRTFIDRAKNDPHLTMLEHGRGILMSRNIFDTVVYNEAGNQVILTKRIPA